MPDASKDERELGFGLIEIIVSMALIGLMFAAFAPLLVTTLQLNVRSAAQATATQVANQQIERVRGAATSCPVLKSFLQTVPAVSSTDSKGRTYTTTQTAASSITCPSAGGALVTYEVTVTTSGAYAPSPVTIETQIWVVS